MNQECQRVQSLVPFYIDGELDEALRSMMHAHAKGCALCASALEFQKELHAEIARHPLVAAPDHYFNAVLGEIHPRMPQAAPRRHRERDRTWVREVSASGFVAALGLIWLITIAGPHLPSIPNLKFKSGIEDSITSSSSNLAIAASAKMTETLVYVQGVGLITANSPILQLPAPMRREIGLVEFKPEDAPQFRKAKT